MRTGPGSATWSRRSASPSSSATPARWSWCPATGLAVAQAQRTLRDLADELEHRDIAVVYAIHTVAGRMPGHRNVRLAEADVPYAKLGEMVGVNPEFRTTDDAAWKPFRPSCQGGVPDRTA